MRAPIVVFALAFGAGLWAGLFPFLDPGGVPVTLFAGCAIGAAACKALARAAAQSGWRRLSTP